MSSDSYGYGALSSVNWNIHTWPPPGVAQLTEEVTVTKSFPPLTVVMPGASHPNKRTPSTGTYVGHTENNPETHMPGRYK